MLGRIERGGSEEAPLFGVPDELTRGQGLEGAEGFELEHEPVGEEFKINAAIGVGGVFLIGDRFGKEAIFKEVTGPTQLVEEADFGGKPIGPLMDAKVGVAPLIARIKEVSVGPEDELAVRQEILGMTPGGRLWNDGGSARGEDGQAPRGHGKGNRADATE